MDNITTERKRTRLLYMIHGKTPAALLCYIGYMCVAMPAEYADERQADGCIVMPCEDGALQSINPDGGSIATIHHYGEDAAAADIAGAMKQRPCLVNYGGTLRAVNTTARGEAAIILKDMQA